MSGQPGGQREGVVHQRVMEDGKQSRRRPQTQSGGREGWVYTYLRGTESLGEDLPLNVRLQTELHSLNLSQELHQVVPDVTCHSTSRCHSSFS